jgi:hypothetical protein
LRTIQVLLGHGDPLLDWHYRQLTPQEHAEHDAILAEIAAIIDEPVAPLNHEFDVQVLTKQLPYYAIRTTNVSSSLP